MIRMWNNWKPHTMLVGVQMAQSIYKTIWQFLAMLTILLCYDHEALFLNIYLREIKTYIHKRLAHKYS